MSARERILTLALREALGRDEPPDLEARIMVAVGRPVVAPARRRRWILATTAAAAAVLLVVWLVQRGGTESDLAWPRDEATNRAIDLPAELAGPRRVAFPTARLALGEGARASLRANTIRLLGGEAKIDGTLRVEAGEHTLAFEEGAGTVRRAGGAVVVIVESGRARVGDRILGAGESARFGPVPRDDDVAPPLDERTRAEVDRHLAAMAATGDQPAVMMNREKAASELNFVLRTQEAARPYARRELVRLARASSDVANRAWDLLAFDLDYRADVVAALIKDPSRFATDAVLWMGETGSKEATAELVRRWAKAPRTFSAIPIAAYLGLRGDPRGLDTLDWFLGSPRISTAPDLFVASCAAKRRLGRDGWERAVGYTRREVNRHLAGGHVRSAADRMLRLAYFSDDGPQRVAYLAGSVSVYVIRELPNFETEDAVRARLAQLEEE